MPNRMTLAVCFTNFGPYHLARLRALAERLRVSGGRLIGYEVAASERLYPWQTARRAEPFEWVTLFPDRVLETIPRAECSRAMREALDRDRPDALGIVGYWRPESAAMLRWARRWGRPSILMSESQAIDRPRIWWREALKSRRVRGFSAALVGGPRHRDYLAELGMPPERIAMGYNAVDHDAFAERAERARSSPEARVGLPDAPYFLAVSRFAPEKNLPRLVRAFARYRERAEGATAWDLVLCGAGPGTAALDAEIASSGVAAAIHRPGFLQAAELPRWYALASAFVLPSLSEPWGLVANEAASCGLPLLISERAGCAETFVPDPPGTTGERFDPRDVEEMSAVLARMAGRSAEARSAMGRRAAAIAAEWGPDRFAQGALEALGHALEAAPARRTRPIAEIV